MILKINDHHQTNPAERVIRAKCPACHHKAAFERMNVEDLYMPSLGIVAGQRMCPEPGCRTHVFFLYRTKSAQLVKLYPTEVVEFDPTGVPAGILSSFREALVCFANECHVAAAIMVRKTLEEICAERGATGKRLVDRLRDLRSKVIIPTELLDALDDLRLLGNDAAHIELRQYDAIGDEELAVAIEVTQEVLKGVYQSKNLLERLKSLKKTESNEQK